MHRIKLWNYSKGQKNIRSIWIELKFLEWHSDGFLEAVLLVGQSYFSSAFFESLGSLEAQQDFQMVAWYTYFTMSSTGCCGFWLVIMAPHNLGMFCGVWSGNLSYNWSRVNVSSLRILMTSYGLSVIFEQEAHDWRDGELLLLFLSVLLPPAVCGRICVIICLHVVLWFTGAEVFLLDVIFMTR